MYNQGEGDCENQILAPAVPLFAVSHENWLMMCLMTCCMLWFGLPYGGGGWAIAPKKMSSDVSLEDELEWYEDILERRE